MQNHVCKLIVLVDVAGELRMARRVMRWLDGVEDPWEDFCDFLEVFHQFDLKTGSFRKTYMIY